jgi:predicted GNAT superfamily acetyltransferase
MEVCWQLDAPSLHGAPSLHDATGRLELLLRANGHGYPVTSDTDWQDERYTAAIPADLEALRRSDREAVLAWRLALREVLMPAFQRGYKAVDFTLQGGLYVYHLKRIE